MIRVLFVDDEPAILEGLENRFRALRSRWAMRFAVGATEALAELHREPADVIVSDMRMPVIDGANLLLRVQRQYPQIVRLVLSGQVGSDSAARVMAVAHQFLTKPCSAQELEQAVERSCALLRRTQSKEVLRAVGILKSLPPLPRLYRELGLAIESPRASSATIGAILEQDVAMSARVLQVANSALFSPGHNIRSVKDAVTRLGLMPLRSIVLAQDMVRMMGPMFLPRGFSIEALQQHSMQVATIAADLLRDSAERDTAFSAGMLHDIGHLVLASVLPTECAEVRRRAAEPGGALLAAEFEVLGCTHAEIGAHLISIWGLPIALVEGVVYHHAPAQAPGAGFGVAGAVHAANALAHAAAAGQDPMTHPELDRAYLLQVQATQRVADWRPAAAPAQAP